jgi:hypothetical protein
MLQQKGPWNAGGLSKINGCSCTKTWFSSSGWAHQLVFLGQLLFCGQGRIVWRDGMRSTSFDRLYTVSRATIGSARLVTLLKQDALLAINIFTKEPCKLWGRLQMESTAGKLCLSQKVRAILMGQKQE